jgi:hypothetical protein
MRYAQRGKFGPSLAELHTAKWTRKGLFHGDPDYPETTRFAFRNDVDRAITISLTGNDLEYREGVWQDLTNPDAAPTTVNPVVSENICLKKRVETLIRTAAISEIEVRHLKEEIREAKQILQELAQVM